MNRYISTDTAKEYEYLASIAREIEEKMQTLVVELSKASIPDTAKLNALKWMARADTFRGLSYFLTPQTEWTGGDSLDIANFKLRPPHIARDIVL